MGTMDLSGETGALFLRFREGDRDALERLYAMHSPALFRYLHVILGSAPDAEDVLQVVWQRVLEHAGSLKSAQKFPLWLRTIARREAMACFRRKGVAQLDSEEGITAGEVDEEAPGDLVIHQEDAQELSRALKEMSPAHREVLWLFVVDGLTHEEIAAVQRIPIGTSRSRLHHALSTLKQSLDDPMRRPR